LIFATFLVIVNSLALLFSYLYEEHLSELWMNYTLLGLGNLVEGFYIWFKI